MSPILPRLLSMYWDARAAHRPLSRWRVSDDVWDRLGTIKEQARRISSTGEVWEILGLPIGPSADLPPNSVVLE